MNERLKIIFLDIDGVLNYRPEDMAHSVPNFTRHDERCFGLNPDLVRNLKEVIDATDAKIVISSEWRQHINYLPYSMEREWREVLADGLERKVGDVIVGDTPYLSLTENRRGMEIRKWLEGWRDANPSDEFPRFIIVDDETSDILPLFDDLCVLKVDSRTGFTKHDANRAIAKLNG